jgi:hypothetical protein
MNVPHADRDHSEIPTVPEGEVAGCQVCPAELADTRGGWLEHHDDGSHTYHPEAVAWELEDGRVDEPVPYLPAEPNTAARAEAALGELAELAELRAEVERLQGVVDALAKQNVDDAERWSDVLAEAEAKVDLNVTAATSAIETHQLREAEQCQRAEAAERALADERAKVAQHESTIRALTTRVNVAEPKLDAWRSWGRQRGYGLTPEEALADPEPDTSEQPAVIDAAHIERQRAWSRQTFGPGTRTAGVLDHIRRELDEVQAAPEDVTEWADVVILAFDGAWRAGHEPQAILDAVVAKQARNEARTWPDWRTADPNRAIEHVRPPECQCLDRAPHRPHEWSSLRHRWSCDGVR